MAGARAVSTSVSSWAMDAVSPPMSAGRACSSGTVALGAIRAGVCISAVRQEYARARSLFEEGCSAGNRESCSRYAAMLASAEGGQLDMNKALDLFRSGCQAGEPGDCVALARQLVDGIYIPPNTLMHATSWGGCTGWVWAWLGICVRHARPWPRPASLARSGPASRLTLPRSDDWSKIDKLRLPVPTSAVCRSGFEGVPFRRIVHREWR